MPTNKDRAESFKTFRQFNAELTVPSPLRNCPDVKCEVIRYYAETAVVKVIDENKTKIWYKVEAKNDSGDLIQGWMLKSVFETKQKNNTNVERSNNQEKNLITSPKTTTANEKITTTKTVSTTKVCLNGSVVSVNDYCTKICPDGESVVETLNCQPYTQERTQTVQPTLQIDQTQLKLKRIQALTQDYNSNANAIDQQIINIKNQYYIDKSNEEKNAETLSYQQGMIQRLLIEANTKIEKLNLQKQQLYLDYQNALNKIQYSE
jgi:hypothetical protein